MPSRRNIREPTGRNRAPAYRRERVDPMRRRNRIGSGGRRSSGRGYASDPVYREGAREGSSMERWAEENRGVLFTVVVIAVVGLLIVAGLRLWSTTDNAENGRTVHTLNTFSSGASEILMNTTYLGNDAYLRLPWNATVTDARLDISGDLPPSRIGFETGRNPSDLAIADVNRDMLVDMATVSYRESTLDILVNEGDNTFTRTRSVEVGEAPIRVEMTDLNDDQYPDALVLAEDGRDLRVLMNDHIGGFVTRGDPLDLPTLPSDMQMIDVEGDGDTDAIVSTTNDNNITIFVNDGSGNFREYGKFLTEGNPKKMAVADMDGDGLEDIVVANRRDLDETIISEEDGEEDRWFNSVSILKNNGDMTFTKMVDDLRTQKGITSMATGDMNGDGRPDIAMANLGYHNVSFIFSRGSDDFQRGGPASLDILEMKSMDPVQVMLRDLDSDGDLDLWALTRSADSILSYTNDGTGVFSEYVQSYVGTNPTSMEMMDFEGDGDLDIVTTNWKAWDHRFDGNGSVSVLINLRDGIFRTYRQYRTGNSPRGVFAKDIDLDGDVDISSANYFGSTVSMMINDGLGRFREDREYPIGLEPYAVVMEDFDNDGHIDGASADEANFRIVLLRSDGDGGFTNERFLYDIGAYPFSLRTGDIDNDGDVDLFTSNYFQNSTTLLFNDGSGDFNTMFRNTRTIYLESNMPYDSLMEDLNGDGLQDLITVNRGNQLDPTDTISVMLNDGEFTFDNKVEYHVGKEPTSASLFDIDNDGDLDVVTSDSGDDTITLLLNDGSGAFTYGSTHHVGDHPLYVNNMDMDGDGLQDVVATSADSNSLTFFRNVGGGELVWFNEINIGSYPYVIDVSDFNSDGRNDLVMTSVNTNAVVVTGCYFYPEDISLNVGIDRDPDFIHNGPLSGNDEVEADLAGAINDYIDENRVEGEDIQVPIRVTSQKEGVVSLSDLTVVYYTD